MARRGPNLFRVETRFQNNFRAQGDRFAKAIEDKVLRPAAYAGARVIYEGMRMKVPVASGELRDAIYHWHDDKRSHHGREVYLIGPNKVKAPHWYNVEYGHWLYNRKGVGDIWLKSKSSPSARGPGAHDLPGARAERKWVPPNPYIRPTWDMYGGAALSAMVVRMAVLFRNM